MHIIRAQLEHVNKVVPLFNAYRMFYKRTADIAAAQKFIHERLTNQDSVILLAIDKAKAEHPGIGFAQLYPTFASLGMHKMFVLNDLYVEPTYRKHGIGRALMREAKKFAITSGALRLSLSTENTNVIGQKLYESEGYVKESNFFHYSLSLLPAQQNLKISDSAKHKQ